MPHLNPARSLGPSFVLNRWDMHWVYWFGPILGGLVAGVIFEFIYNFQINSNEFVKENPIDIVDCSSMNSEGDTYDDLENKAAHLKMSGSGGGAGNTLTMLQSNRNNNGYCSNTLYSNSKLEPIYGGTKSLYCKSPQLTRANLNRSQSVYTKSSNNINRDTLSRSGHLLPTQSMYPMRLTNFNQNQQNYVNFNSNSNCVRSENMYNLQNTNRQVIHQRPSNNTDFMSSRCEDNQVCNSRPGSTYGLSVGRPANLNLNLNPNPNPNQASNLNLNQTQGQTQTQNPNLNRLSPDNSNFGASYFTSSNHKYNSNKINCRNVPY